MDENNEDIVKCHDKQSYHDLSLSYLISQGLNNPKSNSSHFSEKASFPPIQISYSSA